MRRLVLSMLAASSLALLTACGQGGSAFSGGSSGNANRVVLTAANGTTTGIFIVRAGYGIGVAATAVAGSQNVVTSDQNFTFSWAFAPSGTLYQNGSVSGATQSVCPAPPGGTAGPLNSVLSNAGANFVTVTPFGSVTGYAATETGSTPYCIVLVATHTLDGVKGSAIIYVTT